MAVRVGRSRFIPASAAEPQGSTLVFQETFASGNFTKWNSLQWSTSGVVRNEGGGDGYNGTSDYSCAVVAIDGRTDVARFELRDGDTPYGTGNERTEIGEPFTTTPGDVEVVLNDERWIGWDMKFHSTWPTPISWCLVWQWHHNAATGSPPLTVTMDESDNVIIRNDNEDLRTTVQAVRRDVWERWVVHVKFSDNPAVGFIECWVDGVLKVPKQFQRTMVIGDTGNYFKTGIYRDSVHTATMIRYTDNLKITAP